MFRLVKSQIKPFYQNVAKHNKSRAHAEYKHCRKMGDMRVAVFKTKIYSYGAKESVLKNDDPGGRLKPMIEDGLFVVRVSGRRSFVS